MRNKESAHSKLTHSRLFLLISVFFMSRTFINILLHIICNILLVTVCEATTVLKVLVC